ncbi:GNAT family N-acetyltransferase [Frankia sp. AgB1.9]|uniref:GNAT family N-acetyltransferase n=1 Tax=unclassified Frankia TaxID=2632575 RepID=UPI0019345201|nr:MULTISPECIES: GNAT family N-acetyltransferase [unclassified Frankia]MBL7487715.1 GNAT family N-acetyltransferase [Frankia sp. AgW1.1]MBL7548042.1 GNAT family N-acetyltransferase [Frankia sp. AgB1.9]MBL7624118.1 GNAT family N-acetyltransferase [Frankia sp. AgB1.8]
MTAIRRARPTDSETVLTLVREFNAIDGHDHDDARVGRALAPLLADDEYGQVWFINGPDDEPAGYAVLCWGYSLESGGREAVLDEIYVRDRGLGLGSAALPALLAACRAAGVLRVFLETEAPNDAARRFYARHGFQLEQSIWMTQEL